MRSELEPASEESLPTSVKRESNRWHRSLSRFLMTQIPQFFCLLPIQCFVGSHLLFRVNNSRITLKKKKAAVQCRKRDLAEILEYLKRTAFEKRDINYRPCKRVTNALLITNGNVRGFVGEFQKKFLVL